MNRFFAGLMVATACHILFFLVPIYRETVRLPQARGITVRFNPRILATPQKEVKVIPPPPAPITPIEKRVEKQAPKKVPPPKPKPQKKTKKVKKKKAREPKPKKQPSPSPPEKYQELPRPEPRPETLSDNLSVSKSVQNVPHSVSPTTANPLPIAKMAPPQVRKAYPRNEGNPPPKYPVLARRRGWEGTVGLLVMVLEDGKVGDITIEKSSGYPVLDEAALTTVSKYRFVPGLQGDKKVAMRVKVPVHFRLRAD